MKFYDFNLKGTNYNNDLNLLYEVDKLGWDFVKLNYNSIDSYNNALSYIDNLKNIDLNLDFTIGLELNSNNPNEIQKSIKKYRSKVDYISIIGGTDKINRGVVENRRVDILSKAYFKRRDCGINHVLAKEAKRNNVAIELQIKDILSNHLSYRSRIIDYYKEIIKLHRKFKFPLLLTTGSSNVFNIKSPRDSMAIFKSIGLTREEVISGFSEIPSNMIDFVLSKDSIIVEGVRLVGGSDEA